MTTAVCHGPSRAWLTFTRLMGLKDPSLRRGFDIRATRPKVVAIGGNSLDGLELPTARNILELLVHDRVIVTHGNGPQVGQLLETAEAIGQPRSISDCTAQTQVDIGQALEANLLGQANSLWGSSLEVEVIKTRVVVDPQDPAFKTPTKYVGNKFIWATIINEAKQVGADLYEWKRGDTSWLMKEVSGKPGIFRRVVPSPKPLQIHPDDLARIIESYSAGKLVIAVGGGGIPILPDGQTAEAVIDKDLATAVLCRDIAAEELIISTGAQYICHNFRQPGEEQISYLWTKQALKHLLTGQYPAGSMGEKVEAAINALRYGVNSVLIAHPEASWINGEGTILTRGLDLSGRIYNLARSVGLRPDELQRWLVV